MTGASNDNVVDDCIVIDWGRVTSSSDVSRVGQDLFLISWRDEDGYELCLNDTPDYSVAVYLAEEARADLDAVSVIERFRWGR